MPVYLSTDASFRQKSQVELLAFFSGCTLRLLQPAAFDPWLFDVFERYRQVARRLGKRHADIVTPDWLPDFEVSPRPRLPSYAV